MDALLTPITPGMPVDRVPPVHEPFPALMPPMTPPELDEPTPQRPDSSAIKLALHVISTERAALANLEMLYRQERTAQEGLAAAVANISNSCTENGKLVITGVGKSGKIGKKLVATFNSLGIHSTFLHPTEALHGDLGVIKPRDVVLMITFSGRTSELLTLLPHISPTNPLIVMTSHVVPATCPLIATRPNSILLPAPIHESEKISFGLSAPTSSTTVALALGDSLALAIAEKMHTLPGRSPAEVFQSHHPGGAIGAAAADVPIPRMSNLASRVDHIPIAVPTDRLGLRNLDILRTAVRSPGGWVRTSAEHVIAPRRVQRLQDLNHLVSESADKSMIVEKVDWISVLGDSPIEEARQWIAKMRAEPRGRSFLKQGTILGIVDQNNEVSGVVEIEDVVGDIDWDAI